MLIQCVPIELLSTYFKPASTQCNVDPVCPHSDLTQCNVNLTNIDVMHFFMPTSTPYHIKLFQQSVALAPSDGASKFLYLGQLTEGHVAVAHISKGIEVLTKEMEGRVGVACGGSEEGGDGNVELSDAYCALAEIYLTDAW